MEYFKDQYDENGQQFYDLEGTFESDDITPDTDLWALQHNFASVVPTCFDWTVKSCLSTMKDYESIPIVYENQR